MPVMWYGLSPESLAEVWGVWASDNAASPTSADTSGRPWVSEEACAQHGGTAAVRTPLPDVVLCLLDLAAQHRHRLRPTRAHDHRGVAPAADQVLRRAYAHGLPAEGAHHLGRQPGLRRRTPDQALHYDIMQGARQRSLLVDRAEQRLDPLSATVQPGADQRRCRARRDGHAAQPIGIGFAAPDQHLQPAILARSHILHGERDQLGAPQQEMVAEREHRPVAQTPGRVGLRRHGGLEIGLRHALGLARPRKLGAQHAAQGEVLRLGRGRIWQAEQMMRLAQRREAPAQGRGDDALCVAVEKAADRGGSRGERRRVTRGAPRGEDGAIHAVGAQRARGLGAFEPRPGSLPIRRHASALYLAGGRQLAADGSQLNSQGAIEHCWDVAGGGCLPRVAMRWLRLVALPGVPSIAVVIPRQGNKGEGRRARLRRTTRQVGVSQGAGVPGQRQQRGTRRGPTSAPFHRSMA